MTAITSVLSYSSTTRHIDLHIDGNSVARFERHDDRVRTTLVMLRGSRRIDVSPQPRTVPTMLRRHARRRREDPNRWCGGVARLLFDDVGAWGIDELPAGDRDDLDALLASVTFPLGRLARSGGAGPLPFAPRWAMPALLSPNPTTATHNMFGAGATRAMARALPRGMAPTPPAPAEAAPDLRPLGLAWSLRDELDPDRLATILAGAGHWRPPQHWPGDDDVRILHRLWQVIDPGTAVALVLDSLTAEQGVSRLRRALELVEPLAAVCDLAIARTVAQLEEQYGGTVPMPRPVIPPVVRLPAVPLRPPVAPLPHPAGDTFRYPPTIEISHGYQLGDCRFVLPRNADELARWGRVLSNCLADYAGAIHSGRSVVIGLEERGRLVAALELSGDRRSVRQFVGSANARPNTTRRAAVDQMLRNLGLGGR